MEVFFTVHILTCVSLPAACSSGSQRDSDHPGDVPGLEEEEKAGEGWNMFNILFTSFDTFVIAAPSMFNY